MKHKRARSAGPARGPPRTRRAARRALNKGAEEDGAASFNLGGVEVAAPEPEPEAAPEGEGGEGGLGGQCY